MNAYAYTAQLANGAAISGTIQADDADLATAQLSDMGMRDVSVTQESVKRGPGIGRDDFIFFNEQLASLASAGISLVPGLRQLARDIHGPRIRETIDGIANDLEQGQPLESAVASRAEKLPPFYASVVKAGVRAGQLPATLLNLSRHLRTMLATRRLAADALTYPCLVLVLSLALLWLITRYVLPQYAESLQDFGAALPALTSAIINLVEFLPAMIAVGGIVIAAVLIAAWLGPSLPIGAAGREKLTLAIPGFGSLLLNSLRANYLNALAFALHARLPLPESLRLAADATGSPAARKEADEIATKVENGTPFGEATAETRFVPALCGFVISSRGEGLELADALLQLANAYESKVRQQQSMLRSVLAPLGVCVVGAFLGIIVVAMFLPLIELVRSISS